MKYVIAAIYQKGIFEAGFLDKTDVKDWVILEYVYECNANPLAEKLNGKAWIDFTHLMSELPLLGINAKPPLTRRFKHLVSIGLLETEQCKKTCRLFANTTPLYWEITRSKMKESQPKRPLANRETALPVDNTLLPVDNTLLPTGNANNKTSIRGDQTRGDQSPLLAITPAPNFFEREVILNSEQEACFEWAKGHRFWYQVTGSVEDFLRVYCKPNGKLKKQFEASKNLVKPQGGANETHQPVTRKLSPVERVERAIAKQNKRIAEQSRVIEGEYVAQ